MSFKKIEQFVIQHNLISSNQTIILGLSGGPDSVYLFYFLLYLKKHIPFSFVAAHLDHEWRKSSIKDLLFCEQLCKSHQIPFISEKISNISLDIKKTGSKEDLARQYRRFFFEELQKRLAADAIALAHTQDDQLETFFIRLIRGSTISGLSCMRIKDNQYIRPLLNTHKKDILNYLKRHAYGFVTDPTNQSTLFLRNRIRLKLIPTLKQVDSRAEQNILKTILAMQEADGFIEDMSKTILDMANNELNQLDLKQFYALPEFLQKRVLLEWLYKAHVPFTISSGLIKEIIRFLYNTKSTTHTVDTWSITKKKHLASILLHKAP